MCDRCALIRQQIQGSIRKTQSRGTGCLFSIIAAKTPTLEWEVRYRSKASFNTHNHPPSQSLAAYPLHRRLPIAAQNTAQNLKDQEIEKEVEAELISAGGFGQSKERGVRGLQNRIQRDQDAQREQYRFFPY